MKRLLWLMVAMGLLLAPAAAQEEAKAEEEGYRIYYIGNSLTDELKYDAFKNLAATREKNIIWGRQMIPGAPIVWLWDHIESGFRTNFGYPKEAFSKYRWDAITMQPFTDFGREFPASVNFTKLLMENSPDAQVFIYAQWPGRRSRNWDEGFSGLSGKAPDPASEYGKVLEMVQKQGITGYEQESLKNRYEMVVLGLNALQLTKKPVRLIPVGHVYQLLGQKMDAGLVPGYSSIWEFYSDGIHVSNVGSFIVANTFYAVIFQEDPTGLPVIDGYAASISGDDRFEISDELRQVIQESVWEVVASHPLSGVTTDKPVQIASPVITPAVAGEAFRFAFVPSFGKAPYKWSLADGALPAGLALSEAGILSGTPESASTQGLTVAVEDGNGARATRVLQLVVEEDTPPVITTAALPDWPRGQYGSVQLEASGGNGFLSWSVAGEDLPSGLRLREDGVLEGSPGGEGAQTFTVQVIDGDPVSPETAEKSFTLNITPLEGDAIFITKTETPPTIDGKLDGDDWTFPHAIEKRVVGESSEISAAFDARWDAKYLYVAIKVQDPLVEGSEWNAKGSDQVLVFLDTLNNREATYNFDDRCFLMGAKSSQLDRTYSIGDTFGHNFKAGLIEGGYLVEGRIEFRRVSVGGRDGIAPDFVLGFDVAVRDVGKDGIKSELVWRGTADNTTNPSQFGTIILIDKK